MTTILLADHRPLVQAGLQRLLSDQPDLTLVDIVEDCSQLARLCRQIKPAVLFLNATLPDLPLDQLLLVLTSEAITTSVLLLLEPGQEVRIDLHKLLQRGGGRSNIIGRAKRGIARCPTHAGQGGNLV